MLGSGLNSCIYIKNLHWKPVGKINHDVEPSHDAP